jgi:hypothetical protein
MAALEIMLPCPTLPALQLKLVFVIERIHDHPQLPDLAVSQPAPVAHLQAELRTDRSKRAETDRGSSLCLCQSRQNETFCRYFKKAPPRLPRGFLAEAVSFVPIKKLPTSANVGLS